MRFKKVILLVALILATSSCENNQEEKPSVRVNEEANVKNDPIEETNNKNDQEKDDLTLDDGENNQEMQKYDVVFYDYFDTVTTLVAYANSEDEFQKYKELCEKELAHYHKLYNTYDDFEDVNNVKTINDNRGKSPVEVDPEIIELLEYNIDIYEKTNGKINIALGNLLSLWHHHRELSLNDPSKASIPREEELKEAVSHKDISKIEIDKENNTVFINDPDTQIDIGAVGKGYGIKKISEKLEAAGLKHGILSIGGDDVLIGANPSKDSGKWKIAIQNPDLSSEEKYISYIDLENTTVVTSGDYQRLFKVDGKSYHHIIDPDTMYPSKYFKSVTVVHPDIILADALSTYLFIIDLNEGKEVAKEYGAEVLWVDTEGKIYKTEGYEELEN